VTVRMMALGLCVLLAGACGGHGAPQFSSVPSNTPSAEATFGQCALCHEHQQLARNMTATGGHHDLDIKCEACHSDRTPGTVGPGHRSVPACADCHSDQMTHPDPEAGMPGACAVCHTPHGSRNVLLVQEQLTTPVGTTPAIDFTNLLGLADGSFASVTHPGSGVCEVCHTTTRFYRSDGSGEPHFPFACFTCHPHAAGFAPR
jgi:hypothetical protein